MANIARMLAAAILACGAAGAAPAQAGPAQAETYGSSILFDIVRNNERIGSQELTFQRRGDSLIVREVSNIAVKLLFVTVYRFEYDATTVWRPDGRVESLVAKVNDDGKQGTVRVRGDDRGVVLEGPAGRFEAPPSVIPLQHWNIDVLKQKTLINSIKGTLENVTVSDQGPDVVKTADGQRAARRFVYSGDLDLTAWYDADGRWVALRFKGSDGSDIDYFCRRCTGAGIGQAR